ncbi:putative membrane protein YfcA [Rhodopseudomonas julia]|uniref:Probable membrane transporter protein n=1 Tax=Rhodopseudomonas julia TaxID=200617 RepID=A0ABU0C674_9BRAD|nr:sulfite exporter TauE/SafE family protein [Rhodopseudomonas julia]MDQ0325688.1 putative membrane protein YfcA [Rhodopseudomonas julia]
MSLLDILLLVLAGFVSGAVNAVAGGGTFIAFGALTLVGVPPITANATTSITQFPGYVTSTLAYRRELRKIGRASLPYLVVSVFGGLIGALVLLALDNPQFRAMVPWLLIAATSLFAAGPRVTRALRARDLHSPPWLAWTIQFVVAIYGGFFGAGMGIMMLASLGLTEGDDFHRINAIKTLLSVVIAIIAIVVFVQGGIVDWSAGSVMLVAVALGGYLGVAAARKFPQTYVRGFVIAVGLVLTVYYFVAG